MFFPAGGHELRCIDRERDAEHREGPNQLESWRVEGRLRNNKREEPEEGNGRVDSSLSFYIW